jgi:hypothetical protein
MRVCLSRLLISTLIFTASATAQTRSQNSPPQSAPTSVNLASVRWYVLKGPDQDFVVEFPIKPERVADTEAASGTSRGYILVWNDIMLHLLFMDTGLEPDSREGNQLPLDFRQQMLAQAREQGWTVLRSQLLRTNVYEQERWSPMKKNPSLRLHYIERNIVRYGRQYVLACSSIVPDVKANAEVCRRFFDSFRVIGEPQPQ